MVNKTMQIRVPTETHRAVKVAATQAGRSLKDYVNDMILARLQNNQETRKG